MAQRTYTVTVTVETNKTTEEARNILHAHLNRKVPATQGVAILQLDVQEQA